MDSNKTIGKRIKKLRENKGDTQAVVAKNLNVQRETVNHWEAGTRDLKTEYTVKLADYFGVTCDCILRGVKAENVDIHRETGLTDKAINFLKRLSAEDIERPELQKIKDKGSNISEYFRAYFDTVQKTGDIIPDGEPPKLTETERGFFEEYLRNELNKKKLEAINILLARPDGESCLQYIADYLNVKPDEKKYMIDDSRPLGYDRFDADMLRALYLQGIISALQHLCDDIHGYGIYSGLF